MLLNKFDKFIALLSGLGPDYEGSGAEDGEDEYYEDEEEYEEDEDEDDEYYDEEEEEMESGTGDGGDVVEGAILVYYRNKIISPFIISFITRSLY